MRKRLGAAAVVVALCAGAAAAQASVWEAVWRSEDALERMSVVGRARTMSVAGQRAAVARVRAAKGKVRLDYEAGRHRWSLVDNGRELIVLYPMRQEALVHPRPRLAVDRKLAERNYEARKVSGGEVAGRAVDAIEIVPRGGGPAAVRVWLDRETGFALKRERYNVEGNLTTGTEYVEVEYGAAVPGEVFLVPQTWRRMPSDGRGPRVSTAELSRVIGFEVKEPKHAPPGYVLLGGHAREWGRGGMRVAELRYTDGLRVLSVFEREKGEWMGKGGGRGGRHEGRHRSGGTGGGRGRGTGGRHGRGGGFGFGPAGGEKMTLVERGTEKALRYLGREMVVVVVGDVTAEELMRVAKSVE